MCEFAARRVRTCRAERVRTPDRPGAARPAGAGASATQKPGRGTDAPTKVRDAIKSLKNRIGTLRRAGDAPAEPSGTAATATPPGTAGPGLHGPRAGTSSPPARSGRIVIRASRRPHRLRAGAAPQGSPADARGRCRPPRHRRHVGRRARALPRRRLHRRRARGDFFTGGRETMSNSASTLRGDVLYNRWFQPVVCSPFVRKWRNWQTR